VIEEVGDTLEIFGESGTGKTTFALHILKNWKDGKAIYIDSEKNLLKAPENADYVYLSNFSDLYDFVMSLKDGYKLVILDSIGLPILGEFATLPLNQRGDILLKAQAMSYNLKRYAQRNNALVIVLNQPESEFAKEKGHVLRPFGDKSIYFFKEVWRTSLAYSTPQKTVCNVKAFRSRKYGRDTPLYQIIISKDKTEVVPVGQRKA